MDENMKVPVEWLKKYVNIDVSTERLAEDLTVSGTKVEGIDGSNDNIENVVTGKIESIVPHDNAENLVICSVNVGKTEPIQIVTGAKNLSENDIVPVALHGAKLPGGKVIKRGKLRGVLSDGMLCSEIELEVGEDADGIMILKNDIPIGKNILDVLNKNSEVLDLEITSNRPDCLSVIGIAREVSAMYNIKYSKPNMKYKCTNENINDILKIDIKVPELCRRFVSKVIKNVKVSESPKFIKDRLIGAGVRPINNIVDITNYVMLELGKPMHAYDKKIITSNHIVIDRGEENEKFITLDNEERILDSSITCIKDENKTVCIGGIMGGLNSSVTEDTVEVVFESAIFDGNNIRNSSSKLNLRSEASSRFEKNLDSELCIESINRACALVEELGIGDIVDGIIDVYPNKQETVKFDVDYNYINKFLGIDISVEEMKNILERLEIEVIVDGDTLKLTIPSFRGDLNIKEDIAEEVARIYGYNKIPSTLIKTQTLKFGKNREEILEDIVINTLNASSLNQSISYSFVSPKVFDKINLSSEDPLRNAVVISNPLGEDFSIMRTSSIPSMMEALSKNYLRNNSECRLFEIGRVYIPKENIRVLPKEVKTLTIGLYGKYDYFSLKGVIENLLSALGINKYEVKRMSENICFHPGKTAELIIKKESAGIFGEVHPDVCDNYDINRECYMAVLNLDVLYKEANLKKQYTEIPKFPGVTRDMAIVVDDTTLLSQIESIVIKNGGNILEKFELFDIYKGKQVPEGKKSVAFNLIYRSLSKTLTDEETNKVHNKILRALEYNLGAELR